MKKGFTLVELLAVIVILAIILAIAVPTISSLIENSKKSMFQNSAKMILKSMKNDYDGKIATTGAFTDTFILYEDGVRTVYPSSNNLDFTISATDGGIVRHSDGTVTFALYDGTNCLVKTRTSNDVTVSAMDKTNCASNIIYKQAAAPFNNQLSNGDFSDGITGWLLSRASIVAVNNVGSATGNGTSANARIGKVTDIYYDASKKVYASAIARVNNSNATGIRFIVGREGMSAYDHHYTLQGTPLANQWYNFGMIFNFVDSYHVGYKYSFQFAQYYNDAATASGKVLDIKNVVALDLTTIYGSGNEPTKEQVEHNLNKVWFDTITNTPKRFTAGGWVNF